jgi:hypothetical protein
MWLTGSFGAGLFFACLPYAIAAGQAHITFWGAFFRADPKKPGYPLQFLKKPSAFLRDFRFYPLREKNTLNKNIKKIQLSARGRFFTHSGHTSPTFPRLPADYRKEPA